MIPKLAIWEPMLKKQTVYALLRLIECLQVESFQTCNKHIKDKAPAAILEHVQLQEGLVRIHQGEYSRSDQYRMARIQRTHHGHWRRFSVRYHI